MTKRSQKDSRQAGMTKNNSIELMKHYTCWHFFVYQDSFMFGETSSLLTLHLRLYMFRYSEVYKTYLSIYKLYNLKLSQKKMFVKEKKQYNVNFCYR
jgi:hypothetical protein